MIVQDFEKFMHYTLKQNKPFTLENFAAFASSLVHFYKGSNLIMLSERTEAAQLLCRSFNAGMGNRIAKEDIDQLVDWITTDTAIDYNLLQPIFN